MQEQDVSKQDQEVIVDVNKLVSEEDLAFLAKNMESKYSLGLNGRRFAIKNWLADGGVYVTVTLANDEESFVYPVEARIRHMEEELSVRQAVLFLIDYIDVYFEEFMQEDEDLFIPIDWTDYDYEAVNFQLRGQVVNRKAEAMAEKLLAEGVPYTGPNIVY